MSQSVGHVSKAFPDGTEILNLTACNALETKSIAFEKCKLLTNLITSHFCNLSNRTKSSEQKGLFLDLWTQEQSKAMHPAIETVRFFNVWSLFATLSGVV
jgi:hypothetical protein